MNAARLSPSRRREDIGAWWTELLQARRDSGQSQADYCPAPGLDPKHLIVSVRTLMGCNRP